MEQVWPGLIISLTVAAVTALGGLAYRHPIAYHKLGRAILSWMIGAFSIGAIWNLSNAAASNAVSQIASGPDKDAAIAAIHAVGVPAWILLSMVASGVYLVLLGNLWKLLAVEKEPKNKGGDKSP